MTDADGLPWSATNESECVPFSAPFFFPLPTVRQALPMSSVSKAEVDAACVAFFRSLAELRAVRKQLDSAMLDGMPRRLGNFVVFLGCIRLSHLNCGASHSLHSLSAGWDEMVEAQREGSAYQLRMDATCYKYREKLSPALMMVPSTSSSTSDTSASSSSSSSSSSTATTSTPSPSLGGVLEWKMHRFESAADPNDAQPFAFSPVLAGYVQVRSSSLIRADSEDSIRSS